MTLKISADVEPLEAYKVYIDGDFERKVRGTKSVYFELSNSKHTVQLKSWGGKSSIIEVSTEEDQTIELIFETNWFKAMKEGYFKLRDSKVLW